MKGEVTKVVDIKEIIFYEQAGGGGGGVFFPVKYNKKG